MLRSKIICVGALLLFAHDVVAEDVYIHGGDSEALQAAIDAANRPGSNVTIHLQAGQRYLESPKFRGFNGNLEIDGNGAIFQNRNGPYVDLMGTIAADGSVTMTGITFVNIDTGPVNCFLLSNEGNLTLRRVTFADIRIQTIGHFLQCDTEGLLLNEGMAELFNVTITGASIWALEGSIIKSAVGASTHITHLTVADTSWSSKGGTPGVILRSASADSMSVSNSIILSDGNTEGGLIPCEGPITDNGGNFASAGDCGFSGGSIDRSSLGPAVEKGHDSWVVPLAANSVAIDAGNPEYCEKLDGRGFERDAHCDSGAYEAGASNHGGELGRGGVSGIYYTPDGDGNYVQLQRAIDGKVVVIWNTFDQAGNQAWVFGVGSYENGSVTAAKAYRNLGGVLQPGGGATAATVTDWGTITVTVKDCLNITLDYDSNDPAFDTGTFDAQRLAYVHDLGCSDISE